MSEITMVPVTPFGIEKKAFKAGATFIGDSAPSGARYCYNILYRNECDPADNVHRFNLMPENPTFIEIENAIKAASIDIELIAADKEMLLSLLPDSMKNDIWGAWAMIDVSKRPLVRLYTDNVSKIVDGKVVKVHGVGEPMRKKGPDGKELKEFAVIDTLPVWGFLKKNMEGVAFWLKGNDPMARIDREINQGRMAYLDTLIKPGVDPKGLDTEEPGEGEVKLTVEGEKKPETVEMPPLE